MLLPAQLEENLLQIRQRLATAAHASQQDPDNIKLVAVSKRQPTAAIAALQRLGQLDFGENYLQEALPKITELAALQPPLRWHVIGAVQSNKIKLVVRHCHWLHGLCSPSQVSVLSHLLATTPPPLPLTILVQVHLGDESSKSGIKPEALTEFFDLIEQQSHLVVHGLMAIPPAEADERTTRRHFDHMQQLFQRYRNSHYKQLQLRWLSLGMSRDFTWAIAAGANVVRVGTALFGAR